MNHKPFCTCLLFIYIPCDCSVLKYGQYWSCLRLVVLLPPCQNRRSKSSSRKENQSNPLGLSFIKFWSGSSQIQLQAFLIMWLQLCFYVNDKKYDSVNDNCKLSLSMCQNDQSGSERINQPGDRNKCCVVLKSIVKWLFLLLMQLHSIEGSIESVYVLQRIKSFIPDDKKMSHILKQTCSFQLQLCLSMYDILLLVSVKRLKLAQCTLISESSPNRLISKIN